MAISSLFIKKEHKQILPTVRSSLKSVALLLLSQSNQILSRWINLFMVALLYGSQR